MQKKRVYLLIITVLGIWSYIGYQIYNALRDDNEPNVFVPKSGKKKPYNDFEPLKDTSKLNLKYTDPFRLSIKNDTPAITVKRLSLVQPVKNPLVPINWDFVSYHGYLKSGNKKIITILHIRGITKLLSENESTDDVTLIRNYKDSVIIKFNGVKKSLKLKNTTE